MTDDRLFRMMVTLASLSAVFTAAMFVMFWFG
jgi:hypothetical protein